MIQKIQKVESVRYSDYKTKSKIITDLSCVLRKVFIAEKNEKVESVNTQNDYETTSIKWTDE